MVAQYLFKHKPNAKIAVLYQNDDFGRDHFVGLQKALAAAHKDGMLVKVLTLRDHRPDRRFADRGIAGLAAPTRSISPASRS